MHRQSHMILPRHTEHVLFDLIPESLLPTSTVSLTLHALAITPSQYTDPPSLVATLSHSVTMQALANYHPFTHPATAFVLPWMFSPHDLHCAICRMAGSRNDDDKA